jgi:hypothetical protein
VAVRTRKPRRSAAHNAGLTATTESCGTHRRDGQVLGGYLSIHGGQSRRSAAHTDPSRVVPSNRSAYLTFIFELGASADINDMRHSIEGHRHSQATGEPAGRGTPGVLAVVTQRPQVHSIAAIPRTSKPRCRWTRRWFRSAWPIPRWASAHRSRATRATIRQTMLEGVRDIIAGRGANCGCHAGCAPASEPVDRRRGRRAYSAPMTLKSLLTKTWCGQLTAITWTS